MRDHPTPQRPFTLSDFDFALPPELIAQHPSTERSSSRLLDARHPWQLHDKVFKDLPSLLSPGDLLVFNDTQVMQARLFGRKPSGGQLELLVERVLPDEPNAPRHRVVAHMKVSKKPLPGTRLVMVGGFEAELLGRWPNEQGPLFRFAFSGPPHELMAAHGHVPLPPYITHADEEDDDVPDPRAEFHRRRIQRPRGHDSERGATEFVGFGAEPVRLVGFAAIAFDLPDALEVVEQQRVERRRRDALRPVTVVGGHRVDHREIGRAHV